MNTLGNPNIGKSARKHGDHSKRHECSTCGKRFDDYWGAVACWEKHEKKDSVRNSNARGQV